MHYFLYYVVPFVAVLGILIFFHELGHFLVAKCFGVKVLKFSLGFGYKVAGKKIGETEYVISSIPLGGYVKLLGENDEEEGQIDPSEAGRSFNNQHVLKRMAIVMAGPLFNILLALFVYCCMYAVSGVDIMVAEVGQVREGSPAHQAGLLKGDVIVSVDGKSIASWPDIRESIQDSAGIPLAVAVDRRGKLVSMTLVPEEAVEQNLFGEEVKSALIGIVASGRFEKVELGFFAALQEAFLQTWLIIKLTVLTIVKLFQGVVSIKTIGGPIMIGQLTGQVAQESVSYLVPLLAVISINLGILNLLPIPILDGGLMVFLMMELVLGRPVSIKKREAAQKIGLFLLAVLIVVVTMNDLARIEAVARLFEKVFG